MKKIHRPYLPRPRKYRAVFARAHILTSACGLGQYAREIRRPVFPRSR